MKTTTHTPGPWTYAQHIGRTDLTVDFSIGPDVRHIQGPETVGDLAAHVSEAGISCSNPSTLMPVEEAEANTRLIAAAPDLLAALADMLERFQDHEQYADGGDEGVWLTDAQAIAAAREAIAKATGGAE